MNSLYSLADSSGNSRVRLVRCLVFVLSLLFTISAGASEREKQFSNIKIKNFGQVDERLYRGGQPKEDDFRDLATLGVKTVINLRQDPKDYEKAAVEAAGMRYVHIPMSDKDTPGNEQIQKFLQTVTDPANGASYVHCAGGRHRTGVTVAVYRFNHYGWDIERAYKEMKDYDFYTRWGHGPMKDFVYSYYKGMRRSEPSNTQATRTEQPAIKTEMKPVTAGATN
jgi:uncharacterized protein (TIGR01244 family)